MALAELDLPKVLYGRPIDYPPIPPNLIPKNVDDLAYHISHHAIPKGNLRRGQREASEETVVEFKAGTRAIFVDQVSGYGKSMYMQTVGEGYGGSQVYIVPGETATTNIFDKYDGQEIGIVDKNHKEFGCQTTIITMKSLMELHNALARGDMRRVEEARTVFGADLIFADEFHHYLTPKALQILSTFLYINPQSYLIGASASPDYNDEKSGAKLFGKKIHEVTLAEGVDEGVLISPHVRFVKTGISLDSSKIDAKGNFVFDPTISLKDWDTRLLEAYLKTCDEEGRQLRTISYASTIDHANSFAELASRMGIAAEVVTGGTDSEDRKKTYQRLKFGRLGTVVTVQTAIESLDLPWLDGTTHSALTRSWRVAKQMFPRSMRYDEDKKPPWIIQAVPEQTSYSRRPLLATDILGVNRFVNGSVVEPRSSSARKKYYQGGIPTAYGEAAKLEEGQVTAEIIDVDSLFKMSILDRAKLMDSGLASDESAERFKSEVRNLIRGRFGNVIEYYAHNAFLSGIKWFDEAVGIEVNLGQILASTLGIKQGEIDRESFKKFIKIIDPDLILYDRNAGVGVTPEKTNLETKEISRERLEFDGLCEKFKNGELTEDEVKYLSQTVYKLLRNIEPNILRSSSWAASTRIDHVVFNGTISVLSRFLGLVDKAKNYNSQVHQQLLDFSQKYVDEKDRLIEYSPAPVRLVYNPDVQLEPEKDSEFNKLTYDCVSFRKGLLTYEQERQLASKIGALVSSLPKERLEGSVGLLGATSLDVETYHLRVSSIARYLGFGRNFNAATRDKLSSFINGDQQASVNITDDTKSEDKRIAKLEEYLKGVSQFTAEPAHLGEILLYQRLSALHGAPRNTREAKKLMERRDALLNWMEDRYTPRLKELLEEAKINSQKNQRPQILRNIFEDMKSQGWDFRNAYVAGSFRVEIDGYSGSLASLARRWGYASNRQLKSEELKELLKVAKIDI